jgi:hypothetical protein
MPAESTYRLALHGFSPSERELLMRQLKTLNVRLLSPWSIAEPDAAQVDLALCRDPATAPAGTKMAATTGPLRPGFQHSIEFPLRLFALLELLDACSRKDTAGPNLTPTAPGRRAETLLSLAGAFRVGEHALRIESGRVYTNGRDLAPLVLEIARDGLAPVASNEVGDLINRLDLRALVWAVALREPALLLRDWSATQTRVRLREWPNLGAWTSAPWMVRLASLMLRSQLSLGEAASAVGADIDRVAAFVHACQLCGVRVEIERSAVLRDEPPSPARAEPGSFFERLRRRLGLRGEATP